ncbi:MAG: MerR family transcriptional regulator [Planctomycetes bacterium]|nr:MerR family transcriptional regulator [Planctomycetota bacterium]
MNESCAAWAAWNPPPKLYRIGEVVRHSGFSRQTVHNYTTMGLIREEERTEGGHRMYGEDVFRRLAIIKALKGSKTLGQIRRILEDETSHASVAAIESVSGAADR